MGSSLHGWIHRKAWKGNVTKYHKVDIAVTGAPQLLPKQIFLLNSFMKLGPAKESSGGVRVDRGRGGIHGNAVK